MLTWIDIIKMANQGTPPPAQKIQKSEAEWKYILPADVFHITRKKGTEKAFSSDVCTQFSPGIYACACCGQEIFDSNQKFDSGTGWPSFTQPIHPHAIAYHKDCSYGMYRIETTCNVCDAHLGHVFQDGPPPGGLRYCMNALALQKIIPTYQKIVLGGGCFWCTEAVFAEVKGVIKVTSGYSGGSQKQPTYREVCSGLTGHAEVVEIVYDPTIISLQQLLEIHYATHNPTTINQQGADIGTQYRSIICYQNEEEKQLINLVQTKMQAYFQQPIVTEIVPLLSFYPAETEHQQYYANHALSNAYCSVVITPKLQKFREKFDAYRIKKEV